MIDLDLHLGVAVQRGSALFGIEWDLDRDAAEVTLHVWPLTIEVERRSQAAIDVENGVLFGPTSIMDALRGTDPGSHFTHGFGPGHRGHRPRTITD